MIKQTLTLALLVALIFPVTAAANTYQPQTRAELLSYLYGMVAQLQELLELRLDEENEIGVAQPAGSSSGSSNRSEVDVDTLSAKNIENDEAELRARVDFDDTRRAKVWFEYGESSNDLDERTSKYSLTTSDDGDIFYLVVDDLDEDEKYYYRAVAEDDEGERDYGSIRSFTTEDEDSFSDDDDFSISVDDYTIREDDEIEVEWSVPEDDASSSNWIGLYEYGDDNTQYVDWVYLGNDDHGEVYFTIGEEGDYQVRLFLNNSYTDEVKSSRIEVD